MGLGREVLQSVKDAAFHHKVMAVALYFPTGVIDVNIL